MQETITMKLRLDYENPTLPLVVTIVSERYDVITYFINFYLERNFNILLVLDQTMDFNSFAFEYPTDRVKVVDFTKDMYSRFEQRSLSNVNRQRVVYNNIMTQTNCALAFICDADELCDIDAHNIVKFFAKHSDLVSVQLTPWEVFYDRIAIKHSDNIYSGNYCRRPFHGLERIIYLIPNFITFGLNIRFLNRGLISHFNGKQFVRISKGGRFSYGVHTTKDNKSNTNITKPWK